MLQPRHSRSKVGAWFAGRYIKICIHMCMGGVGRVGGGWRGMMTTLVHRYAEQYLRKSRFTRFLQYFRDGGPSYMMMVMMMMMMHA